jgi:hypothetical protein
MAINNLIYSDTFKKWFDTTNSVISEVNGITVYNILAGDGIGITSSSNVFTINHGSVVSGGVTFSGNVNFTGLVSFTTNPISNSATVISVTPKVSGLTAGNVVRIDSGGLTLAKADSAVNSEVLGIVVSETATANVVALSGLIENNLFNKTISNSLGLSGATLFAGQAYFLSAITAGTITPNEPESYGTVSKPIILGVTAEAGSFLTYRGILLEGISAGITAELDNKIIVELDYANTDSTTGNSVKLGDPVCFYKDESDSENLLNSVKSILKTYGKLNNSSNQCAFIPDMSVWANTQVLRGKEFLGLVSKIISNAGSKYILEVTLPGGSFTTTISELDSSFYFDTATTNYLNLNSSAKLVTAISGSKFINLIHANDGFNTVKIVLVSSGNSVVGFGGEPSPPVYVSSGLTAPTEYYNLLPNGAFTVWQRPAPTRSSVYTTSYTTDYLLQPNERVTSDAFGNYTYFTFKYIDPLADRWFAIRNLSHYVYTSGGRTYTGLTSGSQIIRKTFDSNQAEVSGSPLYYIDCKFNYNLSPVSSLSLRPRIENIQPNARLAQGQRVTFSFWGKSDVLGATLDLIYNRYKASYPDEAGFTADLEGRTNLTQSSNGITLGLSWAQYKRSFDVAPTGWTLSPSDLGWFGVGFEFPSSTATISLAQTQMQLGNEVSPPISISYDQELKRCKELYQTSFEPGITYINTGAQTDRFGSANREATSKTLGQIQVSPKVSLFYYPITMSLTPLGSDSNIFCPKTGRLYGVFIRNLNKTDLEIKITDNQGLPWQNTTFGTVNTKYRTVGNSNGNLTSNFSINNSNYPPTKQFAQLVSINNTVIMFDDILFDYVIDADITSSTYNANSFSIPYSTTKIYY